MTKGGEEGKEERGRGGKEIRGKGERKGKRKWKGREVHST